jgi:DNA-binding MarR family transcriptional regulator
MTGLVDRAERRGLVRRTTSPHDGRAVLVSLTEEGQRLARAGAADVGRRIEELTAALDGGQRDELARLASALLAGTTEL